MELALINLPLRGLDASLNDCGEIICVNTSNEASLWAHMGRDGKLTVTAAFQLLETAALFVTTYVCVCKCLNIKH